MTVPITILLVTMNRRDLLEMTLWYLYETSGVEERNLWIWDNASTDDTPDFLGSLVGRPGVRCFRSKENVGLVGAHKRMVPHVKTPYFLTLDDDVWITNKGWASACARVLGASSSIHQLMLQGHPDALARAANDYGVGHTDLDRPFFRVPPVWPGPKMEMDFTVASLLEHGVDLGNGMRVEEIGGEGVVVPVSGSQLPCPISGSCSAWRTEDVAPLVLRESRHPVVDLREAWGEPLQQRRSSREGTLLGYGMFHPCPGPLWHLGRGEVYWKTKCDMAEAIYGRTSEEQRSWLERSREASGWGQPLESPEAL